MDKIETLQAAAVAAGISRIMPGAPVYVTLAAGTYGLSAEVSLTLDSAVDEVVRCLRFGHLGYRGTLVTDPLHGAAWLDLSAEARKRIAEEDAEEIAA